ncbi:antitoxin [Planosporangium sp. 12N6]|uniref:antitoxin n=1 Tax=Planosporangium spinosum TaxID=3402278 RepID=UPI003CE7474B
MGFLDKAKNLLDQHDDKVDKALDKAGEQIDQRTGGKYSEQIAKGVQAAKERTGAGDTSRPAGDAGRPDPDAGRPPV